MGDSTEPSPKRPHHVSVIMDGNGRWAGKRGLSRSAGHEAGLAAAKNLVGYAAKSGISVLSLFAFGNENWQRPDTEVQTLMGLFAQSLQDSLEQLTEHAIALKVLGDRSQLEPKLIQQIVEVEQRSAQHEGMELIIAFNYSGRWDLMQAAQRLIDRQLTGADLPKMLLTYDWPEPDMLIRTSGEKRLSNFMLWPCAYTELYFTEVLWPDFNETEWNKALQDYAARQRRFGKTGEQIEDSVPRT